jgi:hypothetical protein
VAVGMPDEDAKEECLTYGKNLAYLTKKLFS